MRPDLLGFLLGVVASIAAGLILSFRSWLPRLLDSAWRRLIKRPTVNRIKQHIRESGYEGLPKPRHPHYYLRCDHQPTVDEKPTYHLFTENGVVLQQFMGFLIPPLDFGHGRNLNKDNVRSLDLNSVWVHYLEEIGKKASRSKGKSFRRGLLRRRSFAFDARRIIFFDKTILDIFLFEPKWVFEGYDSVMKGNPDLPARIAYNIVQYAFDIARIHQTVAAYPAIECCYLAKPQITSSRYYDFGLYRIEGVPVIYHPIYKKDGNKSIAEEKMYIGDSARQMRGVEQYQRDFDKVWEEASKFKDRQAKRIQDHRNDEDYYKKPESDYFTFDALSLHFFEEGYYRLIREKLKGKGIDIP